MTIAPSSRWPHRLHRVLGACALVLLGSCARLPEPGEHAPSAHLAAADGAQTALGRLAQARTPADGNSALRVLDTGRDAFLERAALVDAAERTIDLQYYIWNTDATGACLARRLYAAAERGVRVRLLLDDINVAGRDSLLAQIDSHPGIEIRIYNPFARRSGAGRMLNFLGEFTRLNRRMHNKSFTVDGSVTIIGGRNIGDEYFDAHAHLNFLDRDVVATGPVVDEVGLMFDTFWNAAISIPIASLAKPAPLDPALADGSADEATLTRLYGPLPQPGADAAQRVQQSMSRMLDAPARLVHDLPPAPQDVGRTDIAQPSAQALTELAAGAREEILIESAYLVMDAATSDGVAALRARGIRVRALTNSLASNDVTANHAAYARVRERMARSGIELHELRPDAPSCRVLVENPAACGAGHVLGLHAKTFVLDRRLVYVGSLNLNLRSAYLNAESGLIVDSPEFALAVQASIERNLEPQNSWRVERGADGALSWHGVDAAGNAEQWAHEPMSDWSRRATVGMIAAFPLEKYL